VQTVTGLRPLHLSRGRCSCVKNQDSWAIAKMTARCAVCVCDFLLVLSCTVSEILCSWPHHYSIPILGVFPLYQIAHVEANMSRYILSVIRPWNYFQSIPTCVKNIPQRHRRTPQHYSNLILWVFPLHQIAHVEADMSKYLQLFGREIIFEVFQPVWKKHTSTSQTDRRTDDLLWHNRALRSIER